VRRCAFPILLLVALLGGTNGQAGAPPPLSGWLSFGNGAARLGATSAVLDPSTLAPSWFRDSDGMDTTQPLVVGNVPERGQTTAYVATGAGRLVAYAPNGYVRWQRSLGTAPNSCQQLDEYGITGTPVVDAETRAIYAVDAFGLLHALDLVTGAERPGWPVRIYDDPDHELVWDALADVRGSIYIGTASFCDRPMEGKLIRVRLSDQKVSSFVPVPKALGGGGGIWGFGGPAYSARQDSLFVVTGNAFEGGTNVGPAFDEAAGYGEHLVQLTRDLDVVAANHPSTVTGTDDVDFAGSPVLFTPPGCDEMVAAVNKNGRLFLWHAASIEDGPFADVPVQQSSVEQPLLTQPAYDSATHSIYVVTFTALVRVSVTGCDLAAVGWKETFPNATLQGSPTVAGPTVWVALSGSPARLRGYDTRTGHLEYNEAFGGMSFPPPSVIGGRLYEGARHAFAVSDPAPSRPGPPAALRAYGSSSGSGDRWQSRENGVFSTADGGKTWQLIYPEYAQRVLRLSAQTGVISVGDAGACNCGQRQLWTDDGGKSWHETKALAASFTGSKGAVYTWDDNSIRQVSWPPLRSQPLKTFTAKIADAAPVPGGVAVLLTEAGKDWDNDPRLSVIRGSSATSLMLPDEAGRVTVRALQVAWPTVVIRTYVYTDDGRKTVRWRSTNGGKSWEPG
jgi:hypothetical protein